MGITCFDGSVVNRIRQQNIQTLTEIEVDIRAIEQKLRLLPEPSQWLTDIREQLRQTKIRKFCVEGQIATNLPIEIEGFLGEDTGDEVDRDEHGTIREIYYYLGCPAFPKEDSKVKRYWCYGTVGYDMLKDLTEILKMNTGKFLKITIEAIPLGESENCEKCNKRFQCLTTKVRG